MNKTKLKYVKYTKQELDRYVRDKNSCITLTNSDMHVGFPPWGFATFQETLTNIIARDKIGKYDAKLDGIVLEVRNIKVFGTSYPVHDDDPINHINLKANFYVFQPKIGSVIKGVVKHISHGHVAVIIYRVFNVSIRFNRSKMRDSLNINQQISFRIVKFDLHNAMPYIEGELIECKTNAVKPGLPKKHLKFDDEDENTANGVDSGISTEETDKRTTKTVIKQKEPSSDESSSDSDSDSDDNANANDGLIQGLFSNVKIKQEKLSDSEQRALNKSTSRKANDESDDSDSSDSSSDEEPPTLRLPVPITKIKKEEKSSSSSNSDSSSSDDDEVPKTPIPLNKIKKEKNTEESSSTRVTFIPRPIKQEPESDIESKSKFKKPMLQTPKRKRESSISEQLDSLAGDILNASGSSKKSKKSKHNDTLNQSFGDLTTAFASPALSSTLKPSSKANGIKSKHLSDKLETPLPSPSKIKQEPQSEDESGKKKKNRKSLDSTKVKQEPQSEDESGKQKNKANGKNSLKSIESNLFDSFLK